MTETKQANNLTIPVKNYRIIMMRYNEYQK